MEKEAVARARDLMANWRAAYVVTPNPEIVMLCREDAAAMQAVQMRISCWPTVSA